MKRLIKMILMITVIRWGIGTFSSYRLELPSGQRLMDCLGEIADAVSDLFQEISLEPGSRHSEGCICLSHG